MRIRTPFLILSIAVFLLFSKSPAFAQQVAFTKGNLTQAKNKSVSEGKLYFAYFYTDWCLPCKWMDDNTFNHPDVVEFVQLNYLAVKINIDDKDGYQMRELYNVEFLPTLIIFNQSGDIQAKFEESLAAPKLLEALKKQRLNMAGASVKLPPLKKSNTTPEKTQPPTTQPTVTKEQEQKPTEKMVMQEESKPIIQETKPVEEKVLPKQTEPAIVEKPAQKPAEKTIEKPAPAHSMPDKPKPPTAISESNSYYAVQVGTFSRFENADVKRNEFREMFGDGVHIKIDNTGKETVYRVMIGRYQDAENARPLVGLLKEQGIEGFVKEVKRD
jgi:cell division septation protein DedD/thiol-disulfide isomerase/thioredoxin